MVCLCVGVTHTERERDIVGNRPNYLPYPNADSKNRATSHI